MSSAMSAEMRSTLQPLNEPGTGEELEIQRGPNWLFVRVHTCHTCSDNCASLASRVSAALDQHLVNRVVLELGDAAISCEQLIEELRVLDNWVQHRHGVLRVCGLSSRASYRLHRSPLAQRFPVYHDREEAVWGGTRVG
jgi:hypothetical protein